MNSGPRVEGRVGAGLEREAIAFIADMRALLERPIAKTGVLGAYTSNTVASGSLRDGLRYEIELGDNVVTMAIFAPAHWQFANDGRGPGRQPPVAAIRQWLTDKGLATGNDSQDRQRAYLIARAIGRRGTNRPPSRFYTDAVERASERIRAYLSEVFRVILGDELDRLFQNAITEYRR